MQLPTLVSAPLGAAYIALVGDAIAGAVTVRFHPWNKADLLRLFVRPGYRRQGVALALLRQALACARERGCSSLRAIAMAGMVEGQRVLGSAGFEVIEPFTEVPASWEPVVFLRARLM
ncbi:MAG: GNAT family N-acetyltransferase [Thermoflexales bacterium]